jgi:hypothetical protein
MIVSDGQSKI